MGMTDVGNLVVVITLHDNLDGFHTVAFAVIRMIGMTWNGLVNFSSDCDPATVQTAGMWVFHG